MFKKIYKAIAEYQQRRADFYIINNFTDRQLKDMGVTRGEIKQRFYQEY